MTAMIEPGPVSPQRKTGLVLWLALINAVGFSGSMAMPFWLTLFGPRFGLAGWSGPFLATGQLAVTAVCNIAVPWLGKGRRKTEIARLGAAAILIGNLLALYPAAFGFVGGCLIAGGGYGILLNATNALTVDTASPSRAYATIQIINVLFSMAFFLAVPKLLKDFGLPIVFATLAGLALLALLCASGLARSSLGDGRIAVDAEAEEDGGDRQRAVSSPFASAVPAPRSASTIVSLGAVMLLFVGESTISSYLVPLGQALAMDATTVGRLMAGGLLAGLSGGVLARLLSNRMHPIISALAGILTLAVTVVALTTTGSIVAFVLCATVYYMCLVFITPFVFSHLAAVDPSGRTASIGPAFLMIGVSLGPSVAAWASSVFGLGRIGLFSCVALIASAGALLTGEGLRRRQAID